MRRHTITEGLGCDGEDSRTNGHHYGSRRHIRWPYLLNPPTRVAERAAPLAWQMKTTTMLPVPLRRIPACPGHRGPTLSAMPSQSVVHCIQEARRLIQQGRPADAQALLAGQEREDGVPQLIAQCTDLLLRKLLRQAKSDEFARTAGGAPRYRLAAARLRGAAALQALAGDATVPPEERDLAQWATGDLRTSLAAMRRRPGWQPLAEGWLLLLRGDVGRAQAAFAQAQDGQPRRAALGAGVCAAVQGDLAGAERLLRGLGPFPQSLYPATAGLMRCLSQHAAGWHPGMLREVMQSGDRATVERTLAGCPQERHEERGWLQLRLGDLRYAADPRHPSADEAWAQAGNLWAPLLPDTLKRRFWRDLACGGEKIPHLARLHEVLARSDAGLAHEALLTILGEMSDAQVAHVDGPHRQCRGPDVALARLAPEWLLVWARTACFALTLRQHHPEALRDFLANTGHTPPPHRWKPWQPIISRLLAELPDEAQVINLRLAVLTCLQQTNELRVALFAALIHDPEQRHELLPRWCSAALHDRRGRRKAIGEAEQLQALFTGDLLLVATHLELAGNDSALRARLLMSLPSDHAALLTWRLDRGPLPEALVGRDELVDRLLLTWTAQARPDCLKPLRRLLWKSPPHLQRLLLALVAENPRLAFEEAQQWLRKQRKCWQAAYTVGRMLEIMGEDLYERDTFWSMALEHAPADAPETAEMRRAVGDRPPVDEDDPAMPFEMFQDLIKRMSQGMIDPGDSDQDDEDEDEDDENDLSGPGGFSSPFAPHHRKPRRTAKVPATAAPAAPPIDLQRIAAAGGCARELDLAGLHRLCALTRSSDGPGRYPDYSPALSDEISRLHQFAPYLGANIRDPSHQAWFIGLLNHLVPHPQRQRHDREVPF